MSDTPETDAEVQVFRENDPREDWVYVQPDFPRKLERERDEARKLADKYQTKLWDVDPDHLWQDFPWEQPFS